MHSGNSSPSPLHYDARLHALIQLGMTLCQGNWKNCRFACRDVDISRLHHCIESALATEGSEWIIAFVRATGVICQDTPHLSWHQPHSLSLLPLPTIAFEYRSVSAWSG